MCDSDGDSDSDSDTRPGPSDLLFGYGPPFSCAGFSDGSPDGTEGEGAAEDSVPSTPIGVPNTL